MNGNLRDDLSELTKAMNEVVSNFERVRQLTQHMCICCGRQIKHPANRRRHEVACWRKRNRPVEDVRTELV